MKRWADGKKRGKEIRDERLNMMKEDKRPAKAISLEESVVAAMDGSDVGLYPFLPYILQDVFEIGADPEVMVRLARAHSGGKTGLRVLDLGCGKGAVSIALARELSCICHGIDALEAFIREAREKAKAFGVAEKCTFVTGDIRKSHSLPKSDIIVLGAIGPVLGNYFETLKRLSGYLSDDGIILIDDGYIPDESRFTHPFVRKKGAIVRQIEQAGMQLADEIIIPPDEMQQSNESIHRHLVKRCHELMQRHPDKRQLFENYIRKQEEEMKHMETSMVCATMVIKRR